MSRHSVMLVSSSQASAVIRAAGQSGEAGDQEALRAELARRVLSGPGLWTAWLEDLDRRGLLEELLADGVIGQAVASAPHAHQLDRALNAKMTVICVLVGCVFPGGYDTVLATAFGLPGLPARPGTQVPSGPALSKARALLGEHVMKRLFELDAARSDTDLGIGSLWHGMETTASGGTTADLFACEVLAEAFGVPEGGTKPQLRIVAHVRTGSRRWIGAAVGGYLDGENTLADELEGTLQPGMLNLADRGFFSMHRWIRFSATGAHLCWRVKNTAKSVPFKTLTTLPDGSELVRLRESDGMLSKRRRDAGDRTLPRLQQVTARLVCFTVTARTASGHIKTTTIRVLTTLLDHAAFPAREIAALYAERWQIEIAFLHLKKTLRGARRVLRGRSPELARQEAWALLLVHNMIATLAARAAAQAGTDPDAVSFTAVLSLVRAGILGDTCCEHCGKRPSDPLGRLTSAVTAHPGNRTGRTRTSGRTAAERRTRHTEDATYTITIAPSNLPKTDETPGS